jgi:hypothetical protein
VIACRPPHPVHQNPLAGMMQPRCLKKSRNIGFSATVSARALKVAGSSFRLFFQKNGGRPQRIETSSRRALRIEPDHVNVRSRGDAGAGCAPNTLRKACVVLRELAAHRRLLPSLHPQQLAPFRGVAWRDEFPPQSPAMLLAYAKSPALPSCCGLPFGDPLDPADKRAVCGVRYRTVIFVSVVMNFTGLGIEPRKSRTRCPSIGRFLKSSVRILEQISR